MIEITYNPNNKSGENMKFFRNKSVNKDKNETNDTYIDKDIYINIFKIKNDFGYSDDLKLNYFKFNENLICAILFISTLVDINAINKLSSEFTVLEHECYEEKHIIKLNDLRSYLYRLPDLKKDSNYNILCDNLLSGNTIFLINGLNTFYTVVTIKEDGRAIEEPSSQTVIRGPKEGFTENINRNILQIRKRIRNKALRIENLSIGSVTKTKVGLMYIKKIAKDEIVQEIKNRLSKIKIDGILEGGQIEELIKDDRYSIFPTFLTSERPDSVSASLLEGKVAILVDGTPFVMTAPAILVEFFQSSEDYYHHYIVSSAMRILRFISFFFTLLTPSIYIAVTTFHQEMLPTPLLISIASQHEGVPFPALIEALLMATIFEILREAGTRMPRAIGPAISIVGALVIGQSAVEAGLISAVIVIVVALTAISSFAITNYEMSNALRLLRFILMFLAGTFGLYGVFIGLMILLLHLCKLKSISVPYLTPIAPKLNTGNKDSLFRFPLWKMKYRPPYFSDNDTTRVYAPDPTSLKQREKRELKDK